MQTSPRVILVIESNPLATKRLQLEEELRALDLGLREGAKERPFDLRLAPALRPRDLGDSLRRWRPRILHFSGHGDKRGILLRGDQDEVKVVEAEALALMVSLFDHVEGVVLNACYTANHAACVATRIPFAIGMDGLLSEHSAQVFAYVFYRAMASGEVVRRAFEEAVAALALEGTGEEKVPRLFMRDVLSEGATPTPT